MTLARCYELHSIGHDGDKRPEKHQKYAGVGVL